MRDIVVASMLLGLLAIAALVPSLPADGARVASAGSASPTLASGPPKPLPTMSLATPGPLRPFPAVKAPIDLALPATCQLQSSHRHDDGAGTTWSVQCGSAQANRGVADLVLAQGWTRLDGPPIGVGLQNYVKRTAFGGIWMQLAWVLSGPTPFAEPFVIVQYTRGYDGSPTVNVPAG